jgi:uncharacterized heparinase superfamily protein
VRWASDADHDEFVGSHDGYRRLSDGIIHTRRIRFDKHRLTWRIEDHLKGTGSHLVQVFFHPGVPFDLEDDEAVRLRAPRADVWLFPPARTLFRQDQGWISKGYGLRQPAPVLVYATNGKTPMRLRTDLVLVPSGTPAEAARSLLEPD